MVMKNDRKCSHLLRPGTKAISIILENPLIGKKPLRIVRMSSRIQIQLIYIWIKNISDWIRILGHRFKVIRFVSNPNK